MKIKRNHLLVAVGLALFSQTVIANVISKKPDLGDYWNPLSSTETYIYANSFVANSSGLVTDLGIWLKGGSSDIVLQIYSSLGSNFDNGPDSLTVLATTSVLSNLFFPSLTYIDIPIFSSSYLTEGNTYWFAVSTLGLSGSGSFYVGGHTQNSEGIADSGTFWYSNDYTGVYFEGQKFTTEMGFTVNINTTNVPEVSSLALLASGLAMFAVSRERKLSWISSSINV
jgi:hypothetical protein